MCVCTRGRRRRRRLLPRWSILMEAKKATKISVVCVEGRIMGAACVPVPASLPRFLPAANLGGGGGGGDDIWEQFLSAPAKVVKGLISSHAGARAKKNSFLQEFNTIYPSRQVFQYGRQA